MKVYPIEIDQGITEELLNKLEKDLQLSSVKGFREQVKNIYNLFTKTDSTQVEINPWAVNPKNEIYSVDAKINIDDNAKFRQTELT